jgi:hypothetical protein
MPRYYFHFRNGVSVKDPHGLVFPNPEAAISAAQIVVENVSRTRDPNVRDTHLLVEVIDDTDQILATVKPSPEE